MKSLKVALAEQTMTQRNTEARKVMLQMRRMEQLQRTEGFTEVPKKSKPSRSISRDHYRTTIKNT